MCRNIKTLYNFSPPATNEEIRAAAEQYVRKISGFTHPSLINEPAFERAVQKITAQTQELINSLSTKATPHNREQEAKKAHERAIKRFGTT